MITGWWSLAPSQSPFGIHGSSVVMIDLVRNRSTMLRPKRVTKLGSARALTSQPHLVSNAFLHNLYLALDPRQVEILGLHDCSFLDALHEHRLRDFIHRLGRNPFADNKELEHWLRDGAAVRGSQPWRTDRGHVVN
eukprot:IDg6554t1